MSTLVVDASVALAWLFDDERDPRADRALNRVIESGALVPHLWHLETRNALLTAERRGRLSATEVSERLDSLNWLPIWVDDSPNLQVTFGLARLHDLSFYDAIYLELARRRDAELATFDEALCIAASAEGVTLAV